MPMECANQLITGDVANSASPSVDARRTPLFDQPGWVAEFCTTPPVVDCTYERRTSDNNILDKVHTYLSATTGGRYFLWRLARGYS
jgi:hypothetical protein